MHSTEYNGCKKKESKWLVIWNGGSSIILVNLELELHYFLFGGNNLFPWLRAQRRNFLILKCCSAKKGALVTWFTLWEVQMFSHSWVDIVEKKRASDWLTYIVQEGRFELSISWLFFYSRFIQTVWLYLVHEQPKIFLGSLTLYKGAWRQLQHCMIKFLRYLHTNWMNLDKSIHI